MTYFDLPPSPFTKPFENIVEKGENAGNQHFLLSHNVSDSMKDKI